MSDYMLKRDGQSRSPFDDIMHVEDDGTTRIEWWSGRELGEALDYPYWRHFEPVITRAKENCRNAGNDPADHFADARKIVGIGSKAVRATSDVQMTRYGCYLVALNADPSKPQVAAAKRYFAVMTRKAELGADIEVARRAAPTSRESPAIARPWSVRFSETMQPHMLYVNVHHPRCFTVVTASIPHLLHLEDELIRHLFRPKPSDRPDISIGRRWSGYRKGLGLSSSVRTAPLMLPDQGMEVNLWVYDREEKGTFEDWLNDVYLAQDLPEYLANKPEFKAYGPLPPASAADHTCRGLTGRPAILPAKIRRQLAAVGGIAKVGTKIPELEPPRPMLDLFD